MHTAFWGVCSGAPVGNRTECELRACDVRLTDALRLVTRSIGRRVYPDTAPLVPLGQIVLS